MEYVLMAEDTLEKLDVTVTVYFSKRAKNKVTFDHNMATSFDSKDEAEEEKKIRDLYYFEVIPMPENLRG